MGKSLREAADLAGISRRAATYWLADDEHPVTIEYDKRRAEALAAFDKRLSTLQDLALQALQDLLSGDTPAQFRMQAVKMIWDASLSNWCTEVKQPKSSLDLAQRAANERAAEVGEEVHLLVSLWDETGGPRIND